MSETKKTLFSTDRFDVIEKDGRTGIEPKHMSVALLPFIRDVKGLPLQLGIIKEYNKIKSKDTYTVITGRIEGEDPDVLSAAQSKMLEVSGLDVQEPERWFYLGFIQTHKMINQEIPCFACDITGMSLPENEEKDDEKEKNEKVEFMVVGVNQALDTDDCYIPTLFMKMFRYIFGHGTDQKEEAVQSQSSEASLSDVKKLSQIDGVVGAGRGDDGIWMIHVSASADKDSVSSKVKSLLGDDAKFEIHVQKETKSE